MRCRRRRAVIDMPTARRRQGRPTVLMMEAMTSRVLWVFAARLRRTRSANYAGMCFWRGIGQASGKLRKCYVASGTSAEASSQRKRAVKDRLSKQFGRPIRGRLRGRKSKHRANRSSRPFNSGLNSRMNNNRSSVITTERACPQSASCERWAFGDET